MRTSAACEDEIVRTTATGESNVLPMLDRLTRWALGGGGDSPADLLAELAQRAGARAAMGLDLFLPDRTPRVVVRWQPDRLTPAQESALVRLAQRTDGDGAVAVSTLDGDLVGLLRRPRDSAFCLLLVAAAPGNDVEAALRLATRLFAHHYLREAASPPPTEETHGLVFAAGFVVGESLPMRELYAHVAALARAHLPVLVLGETGAGKEHVARLLHDSSSRAAGPFVTINCAAIPGELLESELFGIGRGVATGVDERLGRFQQADGGTLFLDEIGDLPLTLQAKLLRALEERVVQVVGGRAVAVDVRVVAATNSDLGAMASEGRFRTDLYHRLAGFVVEVPPLRDRPADVPLLFGSFLAAATRRPVAMTPALVTALLRHAWPGNVRELRHEAMRVAAQLGGGDTADVTHLSPETLGARDSAAETMARGTLDEELDRVERALIASTLEAVGGSQRKACVRLGISRDRLRRRLEELGLEYRR